jgi:pro-apoptotic serine protease NMA111
VRFSTSRAITEYLIFLFVSGIYFWSAEMDVQEKPSFIVIPRRPKDKELFNTPTAQCPTPMSTSPTDLRSGANTPSFTRARHVSSNNFASSPAPPVLSAVSPPLPPNGVDFPVRYPIQNPSERTSYFSPPGSDLVFHKQPVVSYSPATVSLERQLSTAERWNVTLERAIKGIVSIKATTLRSFDTESAGSYTATGFIVDRERGIILSNRHVVNPSPTTSNAVFGNYEEVPLEPVYYDPVHDFGFFKYDPAKIKFAEIEEIELCPQGAKVGLDIKVCGNDAGEKLSILGSTLARLDRAAPYYGDDAYNDFNTFYYQAASGTSGGSSGSPVLDIHGRAVALNAGGSRKSASSFYLPLDRVVRALKLIQEGKPVPRGTLQTEFVHSSYDELKRLGLPQEVERECRERNKASHGLLSISSLLPEGPGSKAGVEVGDMLLECFHPGFGRRYITNFYGLWEIIDESVDDEIELTFYRGRDRRVVNVKVQDLHSITPNRFLEIGEAVMHQLSYQLARSHHLPCKGLFVATSGMFNWSNTTRNFIVTQLDGKEIDSLDTFIQVVGSIRDGKRVGFRYLNLGAWEEEFGIVEIDHHFFAMAEFTRVGGTWERQVIAPTPVVEESPSQVVEPPIQETWNEKLRKSLVMVQSRLPYSINVYLG